MLHSPSHQGFRFLAVFVGLVTALAMAASMSPASAAVDPHITYLETLASNGPTQTTYLRTANLDGSSVVNLIPSQYLGAWDSFDVSQDGNSLIMSLLDGPENAVVRVHREGSATTTRVLSVNAASCSDQCVALSPDGLTAYWWQSSPFGVDSLMKYSAANGTSLVSGWVDHGTYASHVGPTFVGNGSMVVSMSVSPLGDKLAVVSEGFAGSLHLVAQSLTQVPGAPYIEKDYVDSSVTHVWSDVTWADNSTVLMSEHTPLSTDRELAMALSADGQGTATRLSALDAYSYIRPLGSDWWMWTSNDLGLAGVGSTADVTVAPTSITPFTNVDAYAPVPSVLSPPVVTNAVNKHASTCMRVGFASDVVKQALPALTVAYGDSVVLAEDFYSERSVLQSTSPKTIERSFDGTTWHSSTFKLDEPTSALYRNTWLRFSDPGDFFIQSCHSNVAKVSVRPNISYKIKPDESARLISGHVTRVNGSIALSRWVNGAWRQISAVSMNSHGNFTFPSKNLTSGSYRLYVPADISWAANQVRFKIS